jgi:hypothetical protein
MTMRTTVTAVARCVAFCAALSAFAVSSGAAAQTAPINPSTQPSGPPDSPPADPAAPPADPAAAPPAEPTSPAEPAPLAESPMVEQPPLVPPAPPPQPEPEDDGGDDRSAGPFSKGSVRLTLLIGTGSSITDSYLIVGGGPGYFLVDGLEIGLDYEAWIFGDPVMHRLSPETKYILHMVPVIKPYVGIFYRHTFVTGGYEDMDHVGARGGLFYVPRGGGVYVGGGAVYERLLDCESNALVDCDGVYPEIFFGVSI